MKNRLRSLPVQYIEHRGCVILKRGCVEVRIGGDRASELVQALLVKLAEPLYTLDQICELFAKPDQPAIRDLIEQLIRRRLIVNAEKSEQSERNESSLDVFYWHFDRKSDQVTQRIDKKNITIIGINWISRQLGISLVRAGVRQYEIVDWELLTNRSMVDDAGCVNEGCWPSELKRPTKLDDWENQIQSQLPECIVATSDFGGQKLLLHWNSFCIERGIHFLPVVLQDLIGYVGPLTIPGETSCLACLRARENSHLRDPQSERAAEESAFEAQRIAAFHPAMASVLGDVAAVELTKFYGSVPHWRVGTVIEVNLLTSTMVPRRVLKVPRCPECSPLTRRPSASLKKTSFVSRIHDGDEDVRR